MKLQAIKNFILQNKSFFSIFKTSRYVELELLYDRLSREMKLEDELSASQSFEIIRSLDGINSSEAKRLISFLDDSISADFFNVEAQLKSTIQIPNNPHENYLAFITFFEKKITKPELIQQIISKREYFPYAAGFCLLLSNRLLTKSLDLQIKAFTKLSPARQPYDAYFIIVTQLFEHRILNLENLTYLLERFTDPEKLKTAIMTLSVNFILTEKTLRLVCTVKSNHLAKLLVFLNKNNLISESNLSQIESNSEHCSDICEFIQAISKSQLCTQFNFEKVVAHSMHLSNINWIHKKLSSLNKLNQILFERLLEISAEVSPHAWNPLQNVPDHLWTNRFITHLFSELRINDRDQNSAWIQQVCRETIIGRDEEDLDDNQLNERQSTHTTSVHESVSRAARNLKLKNLTLNPAAIRDEIQLWSRGFDKSKQNEAAAFRFINRLLSNSMIADYRDPVSTICLKELIFICWHAIHDDTQRCPSATLMDAKNALIRGLYECQREYNFDEFGNEQDDDNHDAPACLPGSFNKIIEVMVSILKDAEVTFVTKNTATLKLTSVVKEKLIEHLQALSEDERETVQKMLAEDGEGMADELWNTIKTQIEQSLYEEFQTLFKNRSEFNDFLEAGKYCTLSLEETLDRKQPSPRM